MREETALYRALYQSILTQIYSGVIRRGQRFPSQRQICAQYNVGITTVRKAIRMLEEEGVAFADDEHVDMGACQWDGWLDANAEDGAADLPLAPPPDFDWDRELGD